MTVGSIVVVLSLCCSCLVSGWCLVIAGVSESRKITQEKKEERKGEFVNWNHKSETETLFTKIEGPSKYF